MSDRSRYARAPAVLWRRVGNEILVLAPEAPSPSSLSPAAAIVWDELETPSRLDEMTDSLASAFDRDPSDMRADLEGILRELERSGMVVVEESVEASGG